MTDIIKKGHPFPFSTPRSDIEKWARDNGWTGSTIIAYLVGYDGYTGAYDEEEFKFLSEEGKLQCTCAQEGPLF